MARVLITYALGMVSMLFTNVFAELSMVPILLTIKHILGSGVPSLFSANGNGIGDGHEVENNGPTQTWPRWD